MPSGRARRRADDWNDRRYARVRVVDRQTRVCIGSLRDFRLFEFVQLAERRLARQTGEPSDPDWTEVTGRPL